MPAAVPALVITRSSSTKSTSGSTVAAGKRAQLVGVPPVGGARATVEQPGVAEEERAGADPEHPGAPGVGAPEDVQHRLRRWLVAVVGRRDHQVGVRPRPPARAAKVIDIPLSIGMGSPGRSVQARKSIAGHAVVGAVDPEDLLDHAELEQRPGAGGRIMATGNVHAYQYGRNSAESVNPATRGPR